MERAFNPQCVVVIGDKTPYMWLRGQSEFKGKLYSVQIDPNELEGIRALGVENFSSLADIEEPVDLAIVAVPRPVAPRILDDCISNNVAAAHFFTAGFAETHTEEGIKLERILKEKAEQADFHLVGPNCMGIFNPQVGIRQSAGQYTGISGPVGFIAQSGTHAISFSQEAHLQGIDINKSVSFGNGTVLDSANYLEYFGADPGCRVIGMYLEGVKDGRWFFKVLKEVTAKKPVVIWKGGRTEDGGRAISSHTGSLAVPQAIWESAVRQCGAIPVVSGEELIDTLKALLFLPPVQGDRVGITGGSGGQSVAIADVFAEAGLRVPNLTQESYDELATFYTLIGGGYRNPIDVGNVNRREMARLLEILGRDANVDNLVLLSGARFGNPEQLESQTNQLRDIGQRTSKPVIVIVSYSFSPRDVEQAGIVISKLQEGGIPVFVSLQRGAQALKNVLDYYNHRRGDDTQ